MLGTDGNCRPSCEPSEGHHQVTHDATHVTRNFLHEELRRELSAACDHILDGVQQQLQKFLSIPAADQLRMAASGSTKSNPFAQVPSNPEFAIDDGDDDNPWSFEIRKKAGKNKLEDSVVEEKDSSDGTKSAPMGRCPSLRTSPKEESAPLCFEIRRRSVIDNDTKKAKGSAPEKGLVLEKGLVMEKGPAPQKGLASGKCPVKGNHSVFEKCSAPEQVATPAADELGMAEPERAINGMRPSLQRKKSALFDEDEQGVQLDRSRSSTKEFSQTYDSNDTHCTIDSPTRSPKTLSRQVTTTTLSSHLSNPSSGVGFTHHAKHWIIREELELVDESSPFCMTGVKIRQAIISFVKGSHLDYFSTVLILLNALTLGVQTDIAATNLSKDDHVFFKVSEYTFGFCFLVELTLKIYVHKCDFFYKQGCSWNLFDCFVVGIQVVEVIMDAITALVVPAEERRADDSGGGGSSFSVMRVLRLLRLVRVLRMVRIMHLVSELRTIIVAIFSSLRSLAWTMLLLFLIMYLIGVYLTQLVTEERKNSSCSDTCSEDLKRYFGSLTRAILVLYQVITGGINWSDVTDALIEHISPTLAILFSLYVAFVLFALMNVVTGVFVESALKSTKHDADVVLFHQLRHLLNILDANGTGTISWEEFESGLHRPEMLRVFKSIDLGVEEAKDLFRLIDIDGSGEISFDEFTGGCLRLRGPAKAIDMAAFMFDYKRSIGALKEHGRIVEDTLSWITQGGLHELAQQNQVSLFSTAPTQAATILPVKMSL